MKRESFCDRRQRRNSPARGRRRLNLNPYHSIIHLGDVVMASSPIPAPAALLKIADSDPSGSAGIQADLKTFAASNVSQHLVSLTIGP